MPTEFRRRAITMLIAISAIASLVTYSALGHPLDEHPANNYFDTFNAKACTGQLNDPELKPDITVCQQLADKCAIPGADTTHPSCVIIRDWIRPPEL